MKILVNRMLYVIALIIGIVILNFSLFFLSPGDPTNLYFGPKVKKENLQKMKEKMGVNQPWSVQIKDWCSHLLKGDLGYSWAKHKAVKEILSEAIPATLQLTMLALITNLILGCLICIIAGIYSYHWFGKLVNIITMLIYSTPVFLLALFLIYIFSLKLNILPPSGMDSFLIEEASFWIKFWDRIRHLFLPVMTLAIIGSAATSRYVQEQIKAVLKQDYIRMAIAKGLSKKQVYFSHAFKNALLPVLTLLGMYFPFLFGSAFIVEVIFAWPGMGRIAFEAILAKDYPVLLATNLIAGIMVVIGNLISDLLYQFFDPRIHIS